MKCVPRRLEGPAVFSILVVVSVLAVFVTHKIVFPVRRRVLHATPSAFTVKAFDGTHRNHTAAQRIHSAGKQDAVTHRRTAEHVLSFFHASAVPPRKTHPNGLVFEVRIPITGQLGNQMFEYASLLGIARMNGLKPRYRTASLLRRLFHVTHLTDRHHKDFRVVYEKDFATYDSIFENLPQQNVVLMQYLQSWKYFDFIRSTVLREFTFKQSVKDSAANLLKKHSTVMGNKTRVGIHVRRGDFLTASLAQMGYHTAPASYVRKAMDHMREKHGDVVFILVTDDINWCRDMFKAPDNVIADRASAGVHMAVLASCDHVIMTVGTYGWWGAYLAGGDVVYYWDRAQCLHDPPLPVEIKRPQDFFLPSWTPLTG